MNKCSLCGREISSSENSFGLICLNKKKPYLSELIQVVQYFIWKTGVTISSDIFPNGSKYLNHSLQESPEDIYINDKEDILIQTILFALKME